MINAINSNLISLLWAQAESIAPTLWLCTWLCWFFILPLFICLYHGLQDFQRRWHGVDLPTRLTESAEIQPAWKLIQGEFEAIPILPVSSFVLQMFCRKGIKCAAHLSYSLSMFVKIPLSNPLYPIFLIFLSPFSYNILKWIKTRVKRSWRVISSQRDQVFLNTFY